MAFFAVRPIGPAFLACNILPRAQSGNGQNFFKNYLFECYGIKCSNYLAVYPGHPHSLHSMDGYPRRNFQGTTGILRKVLAKGKNSSRPEVFLRIHLRVLF